MDTTLQAHSVPQLLERRDKGEEGQEERMSVRLTQVDRPYVVIPQLQG